jgi:tetratricopeptide (TPR) repeat protein
MLIAVACCSVLVACGQAPVEEADPFEAVQQAYRDAETGEEWLPTAWAFLEEHPENEHVPWVTARVLYHQGDEMADQEGAVDLVMSALERATDPEVRFEIATQVAAEAAELGRTVDLATIADDLVAVRPLTFSDNLDLMEAGSEFGEWALVHSAASAGLEQATPETYRADYPDRELTDEEIRESADRRRAMALSWLGWAQFQQGGVDEAMTSFEEAAAVMPTNYFGVAGEPLPRLWGQALLASSVPEDGLQMLAAADLFAGDEEAKEIVEPILAARDDRDAILAAVRDRFARPIDDATLADYDGEMHSLAQLREDKVMLLAFWFPT